MMVVMMVLVMMMMLWSDVDPWFDDHVFGRLRCASTQHCDTGKHYRHQHECSDRMKEFYSHDFHLLPLSLHFEMQSGGRNSLV